MDSIMKKLERSVSRGREQGPLVSRVFKSIRIFSPILTLAQASSGRGGAGNIRSLSRDNNSTGGPAADDYSQSRGRELPGVNSTSVSSTFITSIISLLPRLIITDTDTLFSKRFSLLDEAAPETCVHLLETQ